MPETWRNSGFQSIIMLSRYSTTATIISSNGSFSGTPVISSAIPIHGPENRLDLVLDIYYEYMTSTLP